AAGHRPPTPLAAVEPQPHQAGRAFGAEIDYLKRHYAQYRDLTAAGGDREAASQIFKRLSSKPASPIRQAGRPGLRPRWPDGGAGAEGLGAGGAAALQAGRHGEGEQAEGSHEAPACGRMLVQHLIAFIRKAFRLPRNSPSFYLCDNMPGIEYPMEVETREVLYYNIASGRHDPGQHGRQLKIPNANPWFPGEQLQFRRAAVSRVSELTTSAVEEYFMSVAFLSAQRSKDPADAGEAKAGGAAEQPQRFRFLGRPQLICGLLPRNAQEGRPQRDVGCCIVNKQRKICGRWLQRPCRSAARTISCHGNARHRAIRWARSICLSATREMNAIMNKNSADVRDCHPSGITEVVYLSTSTAAPCRTRRAKRIFRMADVKFRQFTPSRRSIVDRLRPAAGRDRGGAGTDPAVEPVSGDCVKVFRQNIEH
uniref:DUF2263 domain-containing protein n=1 Tax=Macrostomum lignano TaxID=282301 RepID=A0A1I8JP32_9PLAT